MRSKYGISSEQWTAMLVEQSGRCAICSNPMREPCVDHDHETLAVRGLLCSGCNTGIGHLRDSSDVLRAAIKYLAG